MRSASQLSSHAPDFAPPQGLRPSLVSPARSAGAAGATGEAAAALETSQGSQLSRASAGAGARDRGGEEAVDVLDRPASHFRSNSTQNFLNAALTQQGLEAEAPVASYQAPELPEPPQVQQLQSQSLQALQTQQEGLPAAPAPSEPPSSEPFAAATNTTYASESAATAPGRTAEAALGIDRAILSDVLEQLLYEARQEVGASDENTYLVSVCLAGL